MNNSFSSDSALNIGLLNILQLETRLVYIVELLSEFLLDFMCITETWLYNIT